MKETNTISMMNFEDFKKVIMKKAEPVAGEGGTVDICLLYTSPSPRDRG